MNDPIGTKLSIVIPVLNEAPGLADCLKRLSAMRSRGSEVIVADGGSTDRSVDIARTHADLIVEAHRGRASQMNAGAAIASGDVLLFLHADTILPDDADQLVIGALRRSGRLWGRFDIQIASERRLLRFVAQMMTLRSRLTEISTGDQAIFVMRNAFESAGGYPDIPLMEDVALCRGLKRIGRPLCLDAKVVTSGRRWHEHGIVRTIFLMWWLRLRYFLGAEPDVLARQYGYRPRDRQ